MALTPKPPSASFTVMTQLVFPEHANALGKAFGGQIMAWTDMCGGICSMRHTAGPTVTVGMDDVVFERPILIGETVVIEGRVNAAFRSSLEVEVVVSGESIATGERFQCVKARLTFVAIDGAGQPREVPPLELITDDDRQRAQDAINRRNERLSRRPR